MKFEKTEITGLKNAIIGMRLPMCKDVNEAISKSDSNFNINYIGEKDLRLAETLVKNGEPHCKFLRMIHVQVAITAPLYFWKEADTYKVGTVANSTSTMHRIANYPITKECFEMDDFADINVSTVMFDKKISLMTSSFYDLIIIPYLERFRQKYNETKDKRYWKELIRLLPESWLQTRMIDFNYSVIKRIYRDRKNHKLVEWHAFCDWVETLPYFNEFLK